MGKANALINLLYGLSPLPIAALFSLGVLAGETAAFCVAIGLGIASVSSMFYAKAPALHSGNFLSFGARAVPTQRRKFWWAAWVFIAASIPFFLASAFTHANF